MDEFKKQAVKSFWASLRFNYTGTPKMPTWD